MFNTILYFNFYSHEIVQGSHFIKRFNLLLVSESVYDFKITMKNYPSLGSYTIMLKSPFFPYEIPTLTSG